MADDIPKPTTTDEVNSNKPSYNQGNRRSSGQTHRQGDQGNSKHNQGHENQKGDHRRANRSNRSNRSNRTKQDADKQNLQRSQDNPENSKAGTTVECLDEYVDNSTEISQKPSANEFIPGNARRSNRSNRTKQVADKQDSQKSFDNPKNSKAGTTVECWDEYADNSTEISLNPSANEFIPGDIKNSSGLLESSLHYPDKKGRTAEYASDTSFEVPDKHGSTDKGNKSAECLSDTSINNTASFLQEISIAESNSSFDPWDDTASPNTSGKLQDKKYKTTKSVVSRQSEISKNNNNAKTSTAYETFERKFSSSKSIDFVAVEEMESDLFAMDESYALGHCVAADLNMGSGIAVRFRQMFKNVDELFAQRQTMGGVAVLHHEGKRYVYYLITKRESSKKPTYETLFRSLEKMKEHMIENDVKKLAIPRLGCGLDRLEWNKVKYMLEFIFSNTDIKITVCNFQKADESMKSSKTDLIYRKCPLNEVPDSIHKVEPYSIILYLGTADGHVDKNIEELNARFRVLQDYKRGRRELGKVIYTNVENYKYYLAGCIVKEKNGNIFDFKKFEECIKLINKENNKFRKNGEHYEKVAIQTYKDIDDEMLMAKLTNLMKNTFYGVTITVYRK